MEVKWGWANDRYRGCRGNEKPVVGGNDSWDSPLPDGVQEVPFTPWSCPFPLNYVDAISSERERDPGRVIKRCIRSFLDRTNERAIEQTNE